MKSKDFSEFSAGYLAALLWSTTDTDPNGDVIDLDTWKNGMSEACREKARIDCNAFFEENYQILSQATSVNGYDWEQAGRDFALTRNGHGAGYWDRGLPNELGNFLTNASKRAGEVCLYIGDDLMIHC